jgi:mRNA-degrading endonuclease YafQ of YafQ-DinJ toxin-antitoxin module
MNAIFEPSLLFISDENWHDEEKQDMFLDLLANHLNIIEKFDICSIYWSEEFDILMYDTPQMHPWKKEYWAFTQIIPNIYKILNNRANRDYFCSENACFVNPEFTYTVNQSNAHDYFLKLVHTLLKFQKTFFLCVGIQNKIEKNLFYSFKCDCHQIQNTPVLLNNPKDWFSLNNLVDKFFPTSIEDFEEKFEKAIEITSNCDFVDKEILYEYFFEKDFKKSVISTVRNRTEILKNIAKRLTLTTPQAQADGSLQDKPYKGKEKKELRRMRITQGTRVDYRLFESEKRIVFVGYFDEGQYDKSL